MSGVWAQVALVVMRLKNSSNAWYAAMSSNRITAVEVARSWGRVMYQNVCQPRLAPSISAASYSSAGMFWSAARKRIM